MKNIYFITLLFLFSYAQASSKSDPNAVIEFTAGATTFGMDDVIEIRYRGKTKPGQTERIQIFNWTHRDGYHVNKVLPKNSAVDGVIRFKPPEPREYVLAWSYIEDGAFFPMNRTALTFSVKADYIGKPGSEITDAQNLIDDIQAVKIIAPKMNASLRAYNAASRATPDPLTHEGLRRVMSSFLEVAAEFRQNAQLLLSIAARSKTRDISDSISQIANHFNKLAAQIDDLSAAAGQSNLSRAEQKTDEMVVSSQNLTQSIGIFVKLKNKAQKLEKSHGLKPTPQPGCRWEEGSKRWFEECVDKTSRSRK